MDARDRVLREHDANHRDHPMKLLKNASGDLDKVSKDQGMNHGRILSSCTNTTVTRGRL